LAGLMAVGRYFSVRTVKMFSTGIRNLWPRLLASCLVAVLLACCPVWSARLPGYVDLDGDGFDDNAPDTDLDGIPDEFEAHGFVSTQIDGLQVAPMFAGQAPAPDASPKAKTGEIFGRRKFTTRGLAENRSDFDIGFGSSLGLGAGLGGGGACAGGICF